MEIKNLREWLIKKEGEVDGAWAKLATKGELWDALALVVKELEKKEDKK